MTNAICMAKTELPVEKMIQQSGELTSEELFAIIIGSGSTRENVFEIAKRVAGIDRNAILGLGPKEISREYSLGLKTSCRIKASLELTRLFSRKDLSHTRRNDIDGPEEAAAYARKHLQEHEQEELLAIFLDTRNNVICSKIIYRGTLNYMVIHPRDILREAIKSNSAGIIIAHNHPSGNPEPSKEDIELTKRLSKGADLLSIPLLDHVIIGEDFYSMKQEGIL